MRQNKGAVSSYHSPLFGFNTPRTSDALREDGSIDGDVTLQDSGERAPLFLAGLSEVLKSLRSVQHPDCLSRIMFDAHPCSSHVSRSVEILGYEPIEE